MSQNNYGEIQLHELIALYAPQYRAINSVNNNNERKQRSKSGAHCGTRIIFPYCSIAYLPHIHTAEKKRLNKIK